MRAPGFPEGCLRQQRVGVAVIVNAVPIDACYPLTLAQLQCLFRTIIIIAVDLMLISPGFPVPEVKAWSKYLLLILIFKYVSPGLDAANVATRSFLDRDRSEPLTS